MKKTAEEVESDLRNDYQANLLLDSQVIPDPNHLVSGWLSEDDGIYFWPCILYADIFNFLTFNPSELMAVQILMITRIQRHIAISTEVGLVLFLIIALMTYPRTAF